jgi:hypothetical protein
LAAESPMMGKQVLNVNCPPPFFFFCLISAILIHFRTLVHQVLASVSQVVLQSLVPELPHVMSGHAKALAAILFITIASATSFYPNSTSLQGTSSSESVSTTSSQSASLSDSITATFLLTATSSSDTSWTSSCLYDPGLGYGNCNRPGDPVHEIYINPYDTSSFPSVFLGTPSLANLCSEMFVSDYNQFLGTGVITTTTYPGYTAYPDGPSSALYSPVIDTSEVLNVYYIDTWTYTAEPPCCLGCTLFGGSVQVYYWPTPASSPSVSTLVNSAGFTL